MLTVKLIEQHFPGNVAVVLRPSPATAAFSSKTAHRGDGKTYWVLALVSAATKDRDEGKMTWRNETHRRHRH